ncbi:MAG: polysaccharide deacetylase family protein [Candidatus Hodarchaeales archaeon]|jgi:predicted glycoside hydrolase/deacetylase ChbG (UPF0249 family)
MSRSFIEKIGFDKNDRVVITHIDDMAVSHAINVAAFECLNFGIASCGSIITPAPWFMEVAQFCKNNNNIDVGIHLALTSEFSNCRWRPLSNSDPKSGLIDEEGYLWKTSQKAITNIKKESAIIEMRSQIDFAIQNGIDVTHIDTHMGTVFNPKFIQEYINLALEYRLPPFLPRINKKILKNYGLGNQIEFFNKWTKKIKDLPIPLIDHFIIDTFGEQENKVEYYISLIDSLKPGLTHLLFHPSVMTPESKALGKNSLSRYRDYQAFTDSILKEHIEAEGVEIIGYRQIRDYMRKYL